MFLLRLFSAHVEVDQIKLQSKSAENNKYTQAWISQKISTIFLLSSMLSRVLCDCLLEISACVAPNRFFFKKKKTLSHNKILGGEQNISFVY